jgi:hypothetical protein
MVKGIHSLFTALNKTSFITLGNASASTNICMNGLLGLNGPTVTNAG